MGSVNFNSMLLVWKEDNGYRAARRLPGPIGQYPQYEDISFLIVFNSTPTKSLFLSDFL